MLIKECKWQGSHYTWFCPTSKCRVNHLAEAAAGSGGDWNEPCSSVLLFDISCVLTAACFYFWAPTAPSSPPSPTPPAHPPPTPQPDSTSTHHHHLLTVFSPNLSSPTSGLFKKFPENFKYFILGIKERGEWERVVHSTTPAAVLCVQYTSGELNKYPGMHIVKWCISICLTQWCHTVVA